MTIGPYLPTRWLITTPDFSDDPDIFPLLAGQNFLSLKTPTFSTTVHRARSGRITRLANWGAPIWNFKAGYNFLRDKPPTQGELQSLWAFFANRRGAWGWFYYYDPKDHTVTDQTIATGNGTTTAFQLSRSVSAEGLNPFVEPVYVASGTLVVTVGGTPTTAYTIGEFGMITFDTAPAAAARIAWTGEFMFLCRFQDDKLSTQQLLSDVWSEDGVAFESLKP